MLKVSIATPKGEIYSSDVDFLLIRSSAGEFAILKDHIPVVSTIDNGYVKIRLDNKEIFVAILGGLIEQSNNVATVIAQEAAIAETLEDAKAKLAEIQALIDQENKRKAMDFAISENELKKNIKKAKAGEMM
ncbi:ATP synthase F1 subunit epsilon [Mycoplasmatota bacterium WC44]